MKVHTLDIDSGERDPVLYSNPGDYVVYLKNPIYDVTKISLISARIHNSQFLINDLNNTFTINNMSNNYDITGPNQFSFDFYNGTNGYKSNVTGKTTPHDILGVIAANVFSTSISPYKLHTGSVNLQGTDAIIVKLSSGSDEFNKIVFSETPFYTGRILLCGDVINFSGVDDTVEHNFDSGSQKTISSLRVQFYYSSNNRLIPYDFRNANHILKLAVTCSTDKLENIAKVERDFSLPPPMSIPEMEDPRRWDAFISIFMVVATGLFLLLIMRKPKLIE